MVLQRTESKSNLIDVLDRVIDKGIVIDAWMGFSVVGIELVTVEARMVVASIETYFKHADAVARVTPGLLARIPGVSPPPQQAVARRPHMTAKSPPR
jgi:gas vesicle protein GvpA/GvpJ/GvpM family